MSSYDVIIIPDICIKRLNLPLSPAHKVKMLSFDGVSFTLNGFLGYVSDKPLTVEQWYHSFLTVSPLIKCSYLLDDFTLYHKTFYCVQHVVLNFGLLWCWTAGLLLTVCIVTKSKTICIAIYIMLLNQIEENVIWFGILDDSRIEKLNKIHWSGILFSHAKPILEKSFL